MAPIGLSQRGIDLYAPDPVRKSYDRVLLDPYDATTNPEGLVNLSWAENVRINLPNNKGDTDENSAYDAWRHSLVHARKGTRTRAALSDDVDRRLTKYSTSRKRKILVTVKVLGATNACEKPWQAT